MGNALKKIQRKVQRRVTVFVLLTLALALIAFTAAINFTQSIYERDLNAWQVRLGIVSDYRASNVEQWVKAQFNDLYNVARNTSVQLYMTELKLSAGNTSDITDEPAQTTYLRNYLSVTAERSGFSPTASMQVPANVNIPAFAGMAVVDMEGKAFASTERMPSLQGKILESILTAPKAKQFLIDMFEAASGEVSIGFLVPIFSVQGEEVETDQIGWVVGIKPVASSLYPILQTPKSAERTAETLLVRKKDNIVEYLSPMNGGAIPLKFTLDTSNRKNLDADFVINNPGGFAIKRDYQDIPVLVTGKAISGTPWSLLYKVNRNEALYESDVRKEQLLGILVLIIALVIIAAIAIWRHATSVRAAEAAERYRILAEKFKGQERLLRLVADNQPDAMYLLDGSIDYRFANLEASRQVGLSIEDMVGKSVDNVIGPIRGLRLKKHFENALKNMKIVTEMERRGEGKNVKVTQSKYIPLANIPAVLSDSEQSGMLVVEQDITALIKERERRENTLNSLVSSLVSMVDMRDPYAKHHSEKVSFIAVAVAEEMKLDDVTIETVQIAAKLMNLGKILLPPELLTKKGKLTKKEKDMIADSVNKSAEFLQGIEFEGPVVETIRQSKEMWDGSGPHKLKAEKIIVPAQIINLANAVVAMMSPRSYRPEMDMDSVMKVLLSEIGTKYGRAVVVALINYMENHRQQFVGNS